MKYLRINPDNGNYAVSGLNRNFFDLFEDFFEDKLAPVAGSQKEWMPRVDIYEKDGNYVVKADMPGVEEKDLNVEIKDNILTLSGKKEEEKESQDKNYHRVERTSGSFTRTFSIPEGVEADQIKAEYKKGVLTVTLPKSKKAEPKKIEVKAG